MKLRSLIFSGALIVGASSAAMAAGNQSAWLLEAATTYGPNTPVEYTQIHSYEGPQAAAQCNQDARSITAADIDSLVTFTCPDNADCATVVGQVHLGVTCQRLFVPAGE